MYSDMESHIVSTIRMVLAQHTGIQMIKIYPLGKVTLLTMV
jgi:hypothetical protein